MDSAVIREGFGDFARYAQNNNIPFYIVSGGVDFFIEPLVEKFGPFSGIYCNRADFSGEQIELIYPNSCDEECAKYSTQGCGCCKPSVMRKLAKEDHYKIVIGDSLSDFEAAKLADIVLARDHLIQRCEELHVPYRPFTTFHDCLKIIQELVESKSCSYTLIEKKRSHFYKDVSLFLLTYANNTRLMAMTAIPLLNHTSINVFHHIFVQPVAIHLVK